MPSPNFRSPLVVIWAVVALVSALVVGALLAVVGLPWWLGIVIGFVVGAVVVAKLVSGALDRLLTSMDARPVDDRADPRFENLVEGLSLSTGLTEPELFVVDDAALNGAALAWGDRQTVVLTSGLLEALGRIELEGVLAALLARLKSGDAEAACVMSSVFGRLAFGAALEPVGRPLAGRVARQWFDRQREILNDTEAVAVTRYPPGLTAALQRIAEGPSEPASVTPSTQHLWFAPSRPEPLMPHSPLSWRLDVLSEA